MRSGEWSVQETDSIHEIEENFQVKEILKANYYNSIKMLKANLKKKSWDVSFQLVK